MTAKLLAYDFRVLNSSSKLPLQKQNVREPALSSQLCTIPALNTNTTSKHSYEWQNKKTLRATLDLREFYFFLRG